MDQQRRPSSPGIPIGVWILALVGAVVLLIVLPILVFSAAGVAVLVPFIVLSALLPFALSIIAVVDLWRIVRDRNRGRWETVDVAWAIAFFVFQLIAPLAWLFVGRSARLRDLDARRPLAPPAEQPPAEPPPILPPPAG